MAIFGKWAGLGDGASDAGSGEAIDLLTSVQNERERIAALVTTLNGCTTAIPQLQGLLDAANGRVVSLTERLADFTTRIEALGGATTSIEALERRLSIFEDGLEEAEKRATHTAQRLAGIDEQRQSLEQLASLATGTLAKIDAVRRDSAEVAKLEEQLPVVRDSYQQIFSQQTALAGEMEQLRSTTTALIDNTATTRQLSQEARDTVESAAATIDELRRKVEGLSELDLKTRDTSAQLQTLNALAEHVTSKFKALEHQHQTIEHALVESRRVAEMVWNMDAQIVKLNEGSAMTVRVEETVARLERLHRDSAAELQEALSIRQKLTDTFDTQRRDATELVQVVQRHVDHLAVNKNELDTLSERVTTAQSALAGVEHRLDHVSTIDASVQGLSEKVEKISTRFSQLTAEAQVLDDKQATLSTLEQRLDQADATAKRIGWQIDSLGERRKELDILSARFAEFDEIHGRACALTDALRTDKQQLARFVEQTESFMQDAPSITSKIEALKTSVGEVEAIALKATSMAPKVHELSDHVERLTPRLQLIEQLQERLSELHQLSGDIDGKLAAQLSRRAELDGIQIACDGLSARLTDAQHAFTILLATQTKLTALPEQISALETAIRDTAHRVQGLQQDEEALTAQERRFTTLNDSALVLASDLAERIDHLRGLQTELANTTALKAQLCDELVQLQSMHRETLATTRETEHQLQQLSASCQQIEERRAHVARAERTVEALEHRISELERASSSVDTKIEAIAGRERIVETVKLQVETIHAVAQRAQAELLAVADGHSHLAESRVEVQRLLAELADISAKTADVESRGAVVNDVRRKADAVVCLLDDIRVTLDTVSEQKAMIDHVAEHLVRLDDAIAEARGTTKALQTERKLAQRIVENVRTVHARAGGEVRKVG